jgi:hypothetical protein
MEVRLAILGIEIPPFWDDFHWIPTCKKTQGYNECWFGIGYFLQSSYQLGLGIVKKLSYQPGPCIFWGLKD